ncbi:MAG: pyruvate kinase [Planctomycetes bacterium]|nr:pyruvate kinase [Planctomycetota bacterium]
MPHRFRPDRLRRVLAEIDHLLAASRAATDARRAAIERVPAERRPSAENLAHYLALRAHDLRPLQRELRSLSLSSLGRLEGNVVDTLNGVRLALLALLGELPPATAAGAGHAPLTSDEADELLAAHASELLGPKPAERNSRIMVTLPTAAGADPGLLRDLLRAGMDVARVNLAHDAAAAWDAMADHLRAAEREVGRRCRLLVDLPGPKLRTGALVPGPEVLRVRPERDVLGVVTKPAVVAFRDPDAPGPPPEPGTPQVPLATPLLHAAAAGDDLVVVDTRGKRRTFGVLRAAGGVCVAAADQTAYLGTDCRIVLRRGVTALGATRLGRLPALPTSLDLQTGDILLVTRSQEPGRPALDGADGRREPPRIPCTLPAVFDDVRADQRILFDDGRIQGLVLAHEGDALRVRITATPPGGGRLRAEKGINLPDTEISAAAFGAADHHLLDWAARHADLVGMSFVQRPDDVLRLHGELERRGRPEMGILLKIETALAFQRLPELLFAGLQSPPLGVMVARGDLAAEVGYARLAEVQEEILWLCEAAHVPVVWATQVLDSMARTGVPSRAEVTDAAMGVRAECVMLNKGPYVVETVQFLAGILERMQQHHTKKRSLLRRLRIAGGDAAVPGHSG